MDMTDTLHPPVDLEPLRQVSANVAQLYVSRQGEGPLVGQPQLFLRFVGCNMRCVYCDAPETLKPKAALDLGWPVREEIANPVRLDAVLDLAAAELQGHAVEALAVTGGEPLLHAEALALLLPALKAATGLPVLLETNAQLPKAFAKVRDWVDILSADVKLISVDASAPAKARVSALLQTLEMAKPGCHRYLKVVVGPGADMVELATVARQAVIAFPEVAWFVQPLTADGKPSGDPAVGEALAVLAGMGAEVKVQPQWHVLEGLP